MRARRVTDGRRDSLQHKKNPNNLFLCFFFPTLNKSYWTFPDQINEGDREEKGAGSEVKHANSQRKKKKIKKKKKEKDFAHFAEGGAG